MHSRYRDRHKSTNCGRNLSRYCQCVGSVRSIEQSMRGRMGRGQRGGGRGEVSRER